MFDDEQAMTNYICVSHPLERAGVRLHLDCTFLAGTAPTKNILFVHGVTYSSREFDIDYRDYSPVRRLAREGYAVWLLDIAGFGRSEEVADGFLPDSAYAAEDIRAAMDYIARTSGQSKLDLLGWSWGSVTASRFAATQPATLARLVFYAPILSGLGECAVTEPFHHNSWAHAIEDFQSGPDGAPDPAITDPVLLAMFCSSCWRYDGEHSPNGGRRDLCVDPSASLIDLKSICVPTLILCGDSDPYLNYSRIAGALDELPAGSAVELIPGGSHVVMYEAPYYRQFQEKLIAFLRDA